MSDTPRTDAQGYGDGRHPYVPTEFARNLERELAQIKAVLADPVAVHLNMMRGTIAWTPEMLRHLLGDMSQETENRDTSGEHVTP